MKKTQLLAVVFSVLAVSSLSVLPALAQSCGSPPAAGTTGTAATTDCPMARGTSPAECPMAAGKAPADCPMKRNQAKASGPQAAKATAQAPQITRAVAGRQLHLSWRPAPDRATRALRLTVEPSSRQPSAAVRLSAYYMSPVGNHTVTLQPAGAGVYTALLKISPGGELAVRVTTATASEVVYFGLPRPAGTMMNCADCRSGTGTHGCSCACCQAQTGTPGDTKGCPARADKTIIRDQAAAPAACCMGGGLATASPKQSPQVTARHGRCCG